MVFVVKYRGADGAPREESVEAADRAACVAECRRRGITPMSVREGKGEGALPGGHNKLCPSRGVLCPSRGVWGAAILAAVVIVAGGVWWWLAARSASAPYQADEPERKAATNAVLPKVKKPVPEPPATNHESRATNHEPKERVIHTPFGDKRVKPRYSKAVLAAMQSADAPPIVDLRPPPPDPDAPPPPPPRYKNNLQQQLSEYAWSGRFVGVPDPISNKEARKLVEDPVEILPDDPPEVRQEKETVRAMQAELKEYMENGGRADDYFMKLMKRQDAENETIREARKQIRELCKAGDFELAEQAQAKFNEYLKGKGLPPLAMANYMKLAKKQAEGKKAQEGAVQQKK